MSGESIITSTAQFQTLLIAFVLIVAVIYFFIELRRVDMRFTAIEDTLNNLNSKLSKVTQPIEMETIENQIDVEQPQSHPQSQPQPHPQPQPQSHPQSQSQTVEKTSRDENLNIIKNNLESSIPIDNHNISKDLINKIETEIKDTNEIDTNEIDTNEIDTIINKIESEPITTEPINNETVIQEMDDNKDKDSTILDITFMEPTNTNNNIEDITDEELTKDDISIDDPILEELPNEGNPLLTELPNDGNPLLTELPNEGNPLLTELPNDGNPLLTEVAEFTKYQNHTIKQLKDILNEMDLPTSGNKHKLIQRIVSNKNKISN
jgi:hypothetical protein